MDKKEGPVLNSIIIAVKFRELCKQFRVPVRTDGATCNYNIKENNFRFLQFLIQISNLCNDGKCDLKTFQEEIIRLNYLGLEIFWYLHICKVIHLNQLILAHEKQGDQIVIQNIGQDLFQLYFKYSIRDSQFVKGIFEEFINVIFNSAKSYDVCLYNYFISLIYNYLKENKNFDVIPLMELLNNKITDNQLVKIFYDGLLKLFLIYEGKKIFIKDVFVVQQVLQENAAEKECISKLFNLSFRCFESYEILKLLNDVLLKDSNWENLLLFISSYGCSYEDGCTNLKNMVNNLIEDSFQQLNIKYLSYAFLLARQCCFNRVPQFPSYLQWFSSTFSSESSRPINSIQKCKFFFMFLNDLVECDLPYYLRIHINRVPHVPIECQPILSDYIKLVKTRFCDLNESIELGFFENTSEKSSAEFDVDYALQVFKNNDEIPHCILEACMFNKSYYEKKFLPELMNKFDGKNSIRHKFIVKLHSLGKIANSVFISYKHLNCIL